MTKNLLCSTLPVFLLAATFPAIAADDLGLLEQRAFQAAVDKVAPSVVRIETVGGLERVGEVEFGAGPTTGLVVSEDGFIVSSAFNFVNEPSSILVQLPDGTRKPADLVATDHNRKFVLLKIESAEPLPVPEAVPPEEMRVGQWAIAVGRAFLGGEPNVAVGLVSALGRIWGKAIQTDTAVSPNNYGGPLVDIRGRVLGVLMPLSPEASDELAGFQWYDSGIGFAVPFHDVLAVLPRLRKGDDLHSGLLGIGLGKDNLAADPPTVSTVRPNSPARKAGLKSGDRIEKIDGRPVDRLVQFKAEIARRYAGDTVRLVLLRDGQQVEAEVPLVAELDPYQHPFLGILPMRTATKGDDKQPRGVVVRYVYPDSPAAKAEIQGGDLLVSFSGEAIAGAEPLRQQISEKTPGESVELEVRRGEKIRRITVELATLPEAVPAEPLPPASESAAKPEDGKEGKPAQAKPAEAMFKMKAPEMPNEAWAYVPAASGASSSYGLVVWLHAPGGLDEKALLEKWKAHCDRDRLILLAPKAADPDNWKLSELAFVEKLMQELGNSHTIDSARVVVSGRLGGGTLAYLLASQKPEQIAGVAAIDAPLLSRMPENEPAHRLAFYVARSEGSEFARRVEASIERLREMKYPVTVKELGAESRDLNDEELSELARWIDSLDRI